MIKDNLKNAYKYYSLSPSIGKALKYLENNDEPLTTIGDSFADILKK